MDVKIWFVGAQGMPTAASTTTPLRRHGDEMERLPNGYYVAHGRADDTMNLGGIKVRVLRPLAHMHLWPHRAPTRAIPGGVQHGSPTSCLTPPPVCRCATVFGPRRCTPRLCKVSHGGEGNNWKCGGPENK